MLFEAVGLVWYKMSRSRNSFALIFFFFNNEQNSFICLSLVALGPGCYAWALPGCGKQGCSSLRAAGFSLQWLLLFRSTGSKAMGFSSCGNWGLVAPWACGILPDQASNLCPLHWQAASYPLRHQGNPTLTFFNVISLCFSSSCPQNTQNNTILKTQLWEDTYLFQVWREISRETNTIFFVCLCMSIFFILSISISIFTRLLLSLEMLMG